ncbi:alpha/beta hydrolase [Marinitenerispora sediminis]|uniref:Phospholipase n=1 Tax=Marinitenerispora sediminis TaxID=1931232 RepID=A0A368T1W9_9ACTN|nr:dienelactone hydrolase family protein [Marinitenerispora sediminis]RCV54715.1 phospholipase [Marinitenerispora sediminis]RCV54999.1 phospholipase [Marinitenerispora sediminis]RCV59965.1 phospholipase [Marinitenerispora sediminis]
MTGGGFAHVYTPPSRPGAPTLLLLHGTGADEHDLLGLGAALAPGAALLSPRGRVDENGANRWFRRLREGVFDVADVRRRAHELADFVESAAAERGFDPGRVVAVGFSNGANIAAALLLLRPGLLRAAALFAAAAPLQDEEPEPVDLTGTDVFIGAGVRDLVTPLDQAELLARQLAGFGAHVQMQTHPGGHGLAPAVLNSAKEWLNGVAAGRTEDLSG